MDGFGKQDFLADEDGDNSASSNPNSIPFTWDELLRFGSPNIPTELNRQQSGHPGGTSSDVEMALRNTMGELNREQSGHLGGTNSDAERAWRKRENDRRYRARLREKKLQMEKNMDSLYVENENLKKENERLQHVHGSMDQTLLAQAKLIDQLKNDLDELNDGHKKQNVLVQRLSELLASCHDLQQENERLKLENGQLRHITRLDYNMALADENVKLKLENKVLRVQNGALCGKLISDGDKKHA